ncbi:MAG: 1-deoxy-D-xylulose-5-phosphate reductoisomerase [Candidatus Micrarchaeota archaeon]|nr:1-deoxy-D-xylulose-5-phosphate reductoisomerase [Candidatus Micrarchaeota archaeon]
MKNIAILGSTGSIGTQTLDVIRKHSNKFRVVSLAAYGSDRDIDVMLEQINEFKPKIAVMYSKVAALKLKERLARAKKEKIVILSGEEGLVAASIYPSVDTVVTAVVGSVGLIPTLEAIKKKKNIALANKETLVCAGSIVMESARKHNVHIMPIDSEHSAIFQALQGNSHKDIRRIILTCSGGPFRDEKVWTAEKIAEANADEALKHPTWKMGGKITVDSASLMNKGLEVIEAHWLFNIPYDNIDVVIHPQSIIHSMVEYRDGSIIAQLGVHDMRVPIQYALSYPERFDSGNYAFLDIVKVGQLNFFEPDYKRFPCLMYAYEAGRLGGTMPTVLNAANEVAVVEYFLQGKIKFGDIARAIRHAMNIHKNNHITNPNLQDILKTDIWAREHTRSALDVVIMDKGWHNIEKIEGKN